MVNTHAMYLQYHQIMRSIALWASLRSFGLSKAQCKTYNASRNSCLGWMFWSSNMGEFAPKNHVLMVVLETSDVKAGLVIYVCFLEKTAEFQI